jgi:hypothetical protein
MRSYADAKAYALRQIADANPPDGSGTWLRKCQMFARSCVGSPAWATTALKAWNAIPAGNKRTGVPRAGSIAYWDLPGVTGEAGHAAFVIENGYVVSTDIKRAGKVDICHYTDIQRKWGMRYLGYIIATPYGSLNLLPLAQTTLPRCDLSEVQRAAKLDPARPQGGTTSGAKDDVLLVEHALVDLGLLKSSLADGSYGTATRAGYREFQQKLGFSGSDADGVPGLTSLRALGKHTKVRRKFSVVL